MKPNFKFYESDYQELFDWCKRQNTKKYKQLLKLANEKKNFDFFIKIFVLVAGRKKRIKWICHVIERATHIANIKPAERACLENAIKIYSNCYYKNSISNRRKAFEISNNLMKCDIEFNYKIFAAVAFAGVATRRTLFVTRKTKRRYARCVSIAVAYASNYFDESDDGMIMRYGLNLLNAI